MKAANDNLDKRLMVRTREVWQPRLGRDLSSDEVKQIAITVAGFFSTLAEWARAEMQDPDNDNGDLATSGDKETRDDR